MAGRREDSSVCGGEAGGNYSGVIHPSRRGLPYANHIVEKRPVDRDATLALARGARRLHVKLGDTLARLDGPFTDADLAKHLVHEDGLLRVPFLVIGDVIVRGYSEALYREALDS